MTERTGGILEVKFLIRHKLSILLFLLYWLLQQFLAMELYYIAIQGIDWRFWILIHGRSLI